MKMKLFTYVLFFISNQIKYSFQTLNQYQNIQLPYNPYLSGNSNYGPNYGSDLNRGNNLAYGNADLLNDNQFQNPNNLNNYNNNYNYRQNPNNYANNRNPYNGYGINNGYSQNDNNGLLGLDILNSQNANPSSGLGDILNVGNLLSDNSNQGSNQQGGFNDIGHNPLNNNNNNYRNPISSPNQENGLINVGLNLLNDNPVLDSNKPKGLIDIGINALNSKSNNLGNVVPNQNQGGGLLDVGLNLLNNNPIDPNKPKALIDVGLNLLNNNKNNQIQDRGGYPVSNSNKQNGLLGVGLNLLNDNPIMDSNKPKGLIDVGLNLLNNNNQNSPTQYRNQGTNPNKQNGLLDVGLNHLNNNPVLDSNKPKGLIDVGLNLLNNNNQNSPTQYRNQGTNPNKQNGLLDVGLNLLNNNPVLDSNKPKGLIDVGLNLLNSNNQSPLSNPLNILSKPGGLVNVGVNLISDNPVNPNKAKGLIDIGVNALSNDRNNNPSIGSNSPQSLINVGLNALNSNKNSNTNGGNPSLLNLGLNALNSNSNNNNNNQNRPGFANNGYNDRRAPNSGGLLDVGVNALNSGGIPSGGNTGKLLNLGLNALNSVPSNRNLPLNVGNNPLNNGANNYYPNSGNLYNNPYQRSYQNTGLNGYNVNNGYNNNNYNNPLGGIATVNVNALNNPRYGPSYSDPRLNISGKVSKQIPVSRSFQNENKLIQPNKESYASIQPTVLPRAKQNLEKQIRTDIIKSENSNQSLITLYKYHYKIVRNSTYNRTITRTITYKFYHFDYPNHNADKSIVSYKTYIFELCKNYLSGVWNQITEDDMIFDEIQAIHYTNIAEDRLFYCGLPSNIKTWNNEAKEAQIRLYNMRLHVGRRGQLQESVFHAILSNKIHYSIPKLYGVFSGGKVEEYINSRPIDRNELISAQFSNLIAEQIALLHSFDIPDEKTNDQFFASILTQISDSRKLYSFANQYSGSHIIRKLLSHNLEGEVIWLKTFLDQIKSPIVFSNNNINEGNIFLNLLNKPTLYDYGMASYNYRAYDLAEYLIQTSFDWSLKVNINSNIKKHNVMKQQRISSKTELDFIRNYMRYMSGYETDYYGTIDVLEYEKNLMEEVRRSRLLSHMYWGCWSLYAYLNNFSNHYDLEEYAQIRIDMYFNEKSAFEGIDFNDVPKCTLDIQAF